MALNLKKLGKYMERKQRKNEKPSPILKVIIKIGLGFFWRKDYCPTLFILKDTLSNNVGKEKL